MSLGGCGMTVTPSSVGISEKSVDPVAASAHQAKLC